VTAHALLAYLEYRRHARTRHGVHSPFVFDFVEKVLRAREGGFPERLAEYVGKENLAWLSADAVVWEQAYMRYAPEPPAEMVLVFPGVHRTALHTNTWQRLYGRPEVRLSIDLYDYGLLFFKKAFREKQHFVLR